MSQQSNAQIAAKIDAAYTGGSDRVEWVNELKIIIEDLNDSKVNNDTPVNRFGFAGQDDQAGEERAFNANGFYFQIAANTAAKTFIGMEPGGLDLYSETDGGGLGDYVEIFLEPGILGLYVAPNADVVIDGVKNGTASGGFLALDANDKLIKANSTVQFAQKTISQGINAGAGQVTLTEMTLANVPVGRYEIHAILVLQIAAGATGFNFQLAYTGNTLNRFIVYNALPQNSAAAEYKIAVGDALNFPVIQPVGVLDTEFAEGFFIVRGLIDITSVGDLSMLIESLGAGLVNVGPSAFVELRRMN